MTFVGSGEPPSPELLPPPHAVRVSAASRATATAATRRRMGCGLSRNGLGRPAGGPLSESHAGQVGEAQG